MNLLAKAAPLIGLVAAALLVLSQVYLTGVSSVFIERTSQGQEVGGYAEGPPVVPLGGSPVNIWAAVGALVAMSAFTRQRYVRVAWLGIGLAAPPPHHNAIDWVLILVITWALLIVSRDSTTAP